MRASRRLLAVAALVATTIGCERAPARVEVRSQDGGAASPLGDVAACAPATAEKIGVPFVRVCAREGAGSFWISAIPLGCSAGEHGTLSCPSVTPLVQPPGALRDFRAPSPRIAAVVDAYTAHKVCTMRFAGRLPTRAERARARADVGLATVAVTEGPPGAFRARELAEWVTEPVCAHPTDLGPECREDRFPKEAIGAVSFDALVRCGATPVTTSSRPLFDVGGACAAPTWVGAGAFTLPCAIRGLGYGDVGGASAVRAFELSCERAAAGAEHAPPRLDVAAFRCVLPEWV